MDRDPAPRRHPTWPSSFARELWYAVRRLLRQPGYSAPAVLSLALGIGATVTVFTLLHGVVLRPLPYPEPDRLVRMWSAVPGVAPDERWGLGKPQFNFYREHARSFEQTGLYVFRSAAVAADDGGGRPAEQVRVAYVSASLHGVLGARPIAGRPIRPEENLAEEPAVALLAHDYWRREFGGDPDVVGRTARVDGRPVRIAGVLGPDARLPEELASPGDMSVGLWMPLHLDPASPPTGGGHVFRALGRLRPGVTADAAERELAGLTTRLPEALPQAYTGEFLREYGFTPLLQPLLDDVLGGVGRVLWILFGAVAIVLLVSTTNVANLFLARVEARRTETAVRVALGASRRHLASYFLAEALVVTLTAAAAGLALAAAAVRVIVARAPSIPRLSDAALGWTEVGFTVLVAVGAALLLGAAPVARPGADAALLREAGRGGTPSRGRHLSRKALVIAQLALSLVLLAGAALLLQSFRRLDRVDPGFDPEGVLTFRVVLPDSRYGSFPAVASFYRELTERLDALPGVAAAGLTTSLPLSGFDGCSSVFVEGGRTGHGGKPPCVPVHVVTPGYFRALGVPVHGRAPEWGDLQGGTGAVVVTEALARRLWPGESPLGRGVGTAADGAPYRVTGTVRGLRESGLDRPPTEALYIPLLPPVGVEAMMGGPPRGMRVALRVRGVEPDALLPAVRGTLAELDPQVAIADVRPMPEIVARSMGRLSFAALLVGIACAMAVLLGLVGMYGVVSYLVGQRRSEIGVRLALGASAGEVGRMVLAQSVRLTAVSVAVGLCAAAVATRSLRSLLFEVEPADPLVMAATAALLGTMAVAASYLPTRHAMRVDPAELLRDE